MLDKSIGDGRMAALQLRRRKFVEIVLVLVTTGKHESVDTARVFAFANYALAEAFCESRNTGKIKYWTKAEIVSDGEKVELCQPEDWKGEP